MAAPFFDPRQFFPAPISPITPSFTPSPIVPQEQLQTNVQDILRRQQEEEEERLSAQKMLANMIEEQRNKAEEQRIQLLRQEMPQDIYKRLHESYYGDPKSKAGKVGSAILQIGSGLFGTAPDINKAAMQQWGAQQQAANAADTIQQREQAAAAMALSRMDAAQSRMRETESKNRTAVVNQLVKADIEDAKRQMERMKILSQQGLVDAKAESLRIKSELDQKFGKYQVLGKVDPALQIEMSKQFPDWYGEGAGERLAAYNSALIQEKNARPAIPGSTSTSQRVVLGKNQEYLGSVPVTTTRSGRPEIPGAGALLSAVQQQQGQPPQSSQQAQPQLQPPQPPPVRQPATPAAAVVPQRPSAQVSQIGQPTTQAPKVNAKDPIDEMVASKRAYPVKSFMDSGYVGETGFKVANMPYGTFIGGARAEPETEKSKKEREAGLGYAANAVRTLSLLENAYKDGSAEKVFSKWRATAGMVGADKLWNIVNRSGWAGKDAANLEIAFDQTSNNEKADYLRKISGAQVSDAEYQRLRTVFAEGKITADEMIKLSLYNAIYIPAVVNMHKMGLVTADNSGIMNEALSGEMTRLVGKYMNALNGIAAKRNASTGQLAEARKQAELELSTMKNANKLIEETLRKVYANRVGSTVVVEHPESRYDTHIYIPHRDKNLEKINTDVRKAGAREELQQWKRQQDINRMRWR